MKDKDYLVQVAPLLRLPIGRTQVFSYLSPKPIKSGTLVKIPFHNRLISGIVMESQENFSRKSNFHIKEVKQIGEEMLFQKQLELAKKVANFYLAPLGIILKIMVPSVAKKGKRKLASFLKGNKLENNKRAKKILELKDKEIALIGTKQERDEIIFLAMQKAFEENRQFLYLASEIFPAATFFEKLKKYLPENEIALIHSSTPPGEFFHIWKSLKDKKIKIIVATKIGLFLPFSELDTIAIEESGDISHKQWDMNPRYNALPVARFLAEIHKAKLLHSNSAPSVEIWKKKEEKTLRIINLEAENASPYELKIANIFSEKKSPDFPIGKELFETLSNVLNEKGKSLLVVNRRGFSSYSICQSCKTVLRCPNCDRALVYFEEKEKYKCLHCRHEMNLLSSCPSCGACRFSHQGIGIQLVEKKIKRLFPSARVLRLDSDISKLKKGSAQILQDLAKKNFDILIGTQIALKIGSLNSFGLVAFPSFDELESIPDFNTRELAFALLSQAKSLLEKRGVLLIQTAYSGNPLLKLFPSEKKEEFFEKELRERKKTNNPPFSRIVKLFYRHPNKKKVEKETQKVFDLLQKFADNDNNIIDINEPYEPLIAKKRGYYYKNILIKTKREAEIQKLSILPILSKLKKGWGIDLDPVSTV